MVQGKTSGYNILFKITQMELNHCTLYSTPLGLLKHLMSKYGFHTRLRIFNPFSCAC